MNSYMLDQSNQRMKLFHLLTTLVVYMDFFLTSLMIGNYKFIKGEDPDFMGYSSSYSMIITIQSTDIILNFFKIQIIEVKPITEFSACAMIYLQGHFVTDVISTLPWHSIHPHF